ncbi:MAG: CHAT domain-containing protein [Bryobacterales bacterium]|nr:CHAT domain-containing protein [Bryobacterales bacterium]
MTGEQLAGMMRNAGAARVLRDETGDIRGELVLRLCEQSRVAMRSDIRIARDLAEAACAAARVAGDRRALAESWRMLGHVRHLSGDNRRAAAAYTRAVKILIGLGLRVDAGRTMSSALQSLIYLGRYDQAMDWAARARAIFEDDEDRLRLARLDSNEANILHRQDRYAEALALYERAIVSLRKLGDLDSTGIALRNSAVCHAALYDFDRALQCYREAEALYREKGLPLLAAEIGDNIAQMYHLQGRYIEAMETYRAANIEQRANTYHLAVARLDQSDLLLELNLFGEAAELAEDSAARLKKLGIRYEQGKCLLTLAVAVFRQGESGRALRLLRQARALFQRERNRFWEAAADFYQAAFLLEKGDYEAARASAAAAVDQLDKSLLVSKSISALLLLAKIETAAGRWAEARDLLERARSKARGADTLPVRFQLAMQTGNLYEAEGNHAEAWRCYEKAGAVLETLRGQFGSDGLRLSFVADKLTCHARMAQMAVQGLVRKPAGRKLELVEQAKSRALLEALVYEGTEAGAPEQDEIRTLRQQLSWYYTQLDRADSAPTAATPGMLVELRDRIEAVERRLASEWSLRTAKKAGSAHLVRFRCESLQRSLREDESLIEYFAAGEQLFAFVVTPRALHIRQLGGMAELEGLFGLLRFQMSRGMWSSMVERRDGEWRAATDGHLRRLYGFLIRPLEPWLGDGHWVMVPHGLLHRLPFHALHDGSRYLADQRTISYAPSASVHQQCQRRTASEGHGVAVFGVPDERAPQILREVRELADRIPAARLFVDADASIAHWRREAPVRRLIHLATHGLFRTDNPLFSSLRLSDGRLALYDLYSVRLKADLVTLSGCATGVQEAGGGDELMGLTRGLLIAGARAAHVSLWEVNDESTSVYMSAFYGALLAGRSIALAAREAMAATREFAPHPFHWAPFVLTGNVRNSVPGIFFRMDADPVGERTT